MTQSPRNAQADFSRTLPVEIDISKTALLLIDFQNYQMKRVYPEPSLTEQFVEGAQFETERYFNLCKDKVIPNANLLIERFIKLNRPIFASRFVRTDEDAMDLALVTRTMSTFSHALSGRHVVPMETDPVTDLVDELEHKDKIRTFIKQGSSCFHGTNLDTRLKGMGIDTLIVAGVYSNFCIINTLWWAYDLGYKCVVAKDATAGMSKGLHEDAINIIDACCGQTRSTQSLLDNNLAI